MVVVWTLPSELVVVATRAWVVMAVLWEAGAVAMPEAVPRALVRMGRAAGTELEPEGVTPLQRPAA